jgi:hypothetical protein
LQSGGLVAQGIITYFFGKQQVKELLAFLRERLCSLALTSLLHYRKGQKRQKKTEIACLRQVPAATLTITLTLTWLAGALES